MRLENLALYGISISIRRLKRSYFAWAGYAPHTAYSVWYVSTLNHCESALFAEVAS